MELKPEKVLLFIDWYLPGYKAGGPVSSCANMIEALRHQFEFFVVTRNNDYCETKAYPGIIPNKWVLRNHNEHVLYLSHDSVNYHNIKNIIDNFDGRIIYINGIYSRFFSILPLRIASKSSRNLKIVVAARGMLAQSAIEVKRLKKFAYLKMSKLLGWYKKATFHATNVKEESDIKLVYGKNTRVVVASNITKKIAPIPSPIEKQSGKLRLVSIARIAPEKNLLFVLEVLKSVKGNVNLDIYGQIYDEAYWQNCLLAIEKLPGSITVRYNGIVEPQSVSNKIQASHFLVLPSLGENFGHVIAESFLACRPVLISDQSPWKNLKEENSGFELPLDRVNDWIDCINNLVNINQQQYDILMTGAEKKGWSIYEDSAPVENHLKLLLI